MHMAGSKQYPPVVVVDEDDHEIGSAMLGEVWEKGLYHRIASVFVVDSDGRILLQLRGKRVKIYPNCWDQAVGGHVDLGFSYEETATQELSEELGLEDVTLELLGTLRANHTLDDGRIINQFEQVYLARVPKDILLQPEEDEVGKLKWFTPSALAIEIRRHPEKFTPGLLDILHTYFPNIIA